MGNPFSGYDSHSEDKKSEKNFQKYTIGLSLGSLIVAIAVGIATIYLAVDTGKTLEIIRDVSNKQNEIENFTPQLLYDWNEIKIKNEVFPLQTIPVNMTVEPRSNHFLDIRINNITMRENGWDRCYFKEKPDLKYVGSWLADYDLKQKEVTVNALLNLGYEPYEKYHNEKSDKLSKLDVVWIQYNVTYTDIQTAKEYNTGIQGNLVVEVPEKYQDYVSRCAGIHFD